MRGIGGPGERSGPFVGDPADAVGLERPADRRRVRGEGDFAGLPERLGTLHGPRPGHPFEAVVPVPGTGPIHATPTAMRHRLGIRR